jgi:hypothetical protein
MAFQLHLVIKAGRKFPVNYDSILVRSLEIFFILLRPTKSMTDLTFNERMVLIQHAIKKYENEAVLLEKLKSVLPEKDIQRSLDTLIGTQRVRRIGPDTLQNNESHTQLPELPENLKPLVDSL